MPEYKRFFICINENNEYTLKLVATNLQQAVQHGYFCKA